MVVDSSISNDISEFFIVVFVFEDKLVIFRNVEDVSQNVEGVNTLLVIGSFTGTF